MAQIYEELIVIKLSTLQKSNIVVKTEQIANSDLVLSIEQVVQELVGEGVIVEVEAAP